MWRVNLREFSAPFAWTSVESLLVVQFRHVARRVVRIDSSFSLHRLDRTAQVIRVMMTVNAFEHFEGDSEIAGRGPLVDAALHCPRDRGMPQVVTSTMMDSRPGESRLPCGLDARDALSVDLHNEPGTVPFPSAKVRE